jgi:hypothetical protein
MLASVSGGWAAGRGACSGVVDQPYGPVRRGHTLSPLCWSGTSQPRQGVQMARLFLPGTRLSTSARVRIARADWQLGRCHQGTEQPPPAGAVVDSCESGTATRSCAPGEQADRRGRVPAAWTGAASRRRNRLTAGAGLPPAWTTPRRAGGTGLTAGADFRPPGRWFAAGPLSSRPGQGRLISSCMI